MFFRPAIDPFVVFCEGSETSDSWDVPLAYAAADGLRSLGKATLAAVSRSPKNGQSSTSNNTCGSATESKESPTTATARRGRGRGRSGRGRTGASGRGRGRMAIAPAPLGEVEFADSDLSESLESSGDEDEVAEVGDEHLVVGGVRWKKREGRQIDTLSTNGYQRPPLYKLHAFTEKAELDYFHSFFPCDLIHDIVQSMTLNGRKLGFGATWEVTVGKFWLFMGYNLAILATHTGGPKEDLWLSDCHEKYGGCLWQPSDLGRYGLSYIEYRNLMRALSLPTYRDTMDPFDPIRRFVDRWNACAVGSLVPGPVICVDESMGQWLGKRNKQASGGASGMPGWQWVQRKPTPGGREMFTTACCETGIIVFV